MSTHITAPEEQDSPIECCDDGCTSLVQVLKKPLWKMTPSASTAHSSRLEYGVTVNIQPTKKMNGKFWRDYCHDKQRAILGRIEAKFRALTPSVELIELHYEVCPTLKNVHFHALYNAPFLFTAEMEAYYKRVCDARDANTRIPWRYLDIKVIKDGAQHWLEYIRKEINLQ